MAKVININKAKFSVGGMVHHRLFGYRGVIADVDPIFQLTDEWYDTVARSRPPKDKPWYHVLVHGAMHTTYVAEQNLEPDHVEDPIIHPLITHYFSRYENGRYIRSNPTN